MKRKHFVLTFLVLVTAGLGIYLIVFLGYFPVAVVNSHVITERLYEKNLSAIYKYSDALAFTYKDEELSSLKNSRAELKSIVLTQLIENSLIHREVQNRLGAEVKNVVDNKIKDLKDNEELEKAAGAIYGLEYVDFIDLFLKPLAEKEVLDGRLLLEKKGFDEWLMEEKTKARVVLLLGNYFWNGESVEIKK